MPETETAMSITFGFYNDTVLRLGIHISEQNLFRIEKSHARYTPRACTPRMHRHSLVLCDILARGIIPWSTMPNADLLCKHREGDVLANRR
jgi:hypothetical protein